MIEQNSRDVKITYNGYTMEVKLQDDLSIQEVYDWIRFENNFNEVMRTFHQEKGIIYKPIGKDDTIQLRLNTLEGQPLNKGLLLKQFSPKKRLVFYVTVVDASKSVVKQKTNNYLSPQNNTCIQVGIINRLQQVHKILTVDYTNPAFSTLGDLQKVLQNQTNSSQKTKFFFQNPLTKFIYTDIKDSDSFKDFVKRNGITQLNAVPHYLSG